MTWFGKTDSKKLQMVAENEALAGRDQKMTIPPEHYVLHTPMEEPMPENCQKAIFGMGCFWGAEKLFWTIPGVYTTMVGYGAGYTPNPSYDEVCSGKTGHNEVVKVVFEPQQLSFKELLVVFWENHNPTQGMRQGNDIGTQYRSGIYPTSAEQEALARASMATYQKALDANGLGSVTTEILSNIDFYYAEPYHQQYLAKNPGGYCPNHGCETTGLPRLKTKA